MANEFIKEQKVVDAAMLLLQREIVLPRLVWRQADADFVGQLNDTITLRVPAVLTAATRTMRSTAELTPSELTETSVPVQLTKHIHQLLNITDEQLTLDIRNFMAQVLQPQIRAVAEATEDVIADAIQGATWEADPVAFEEGTDEPYDVLVDARKALNKLNVPRSGRVFLCGADVEAALLKSDKLSKVNESGDDSALRDAIINRVAGFTIVGTNALEADEAFAFHGTAIAFGNVAPALPDGATQKARTASDGLSLRYLRDYNPTNATGPVDRSLVDLFCGAVSVEEGEEGYATNKRGVAIEFTGESSS